MQRERYLQSALCWAESPMSRALFKSMGDSLFLEPDDKLSRLDAYNHASIIPSASDSSQNDLDTPPCNSSLTNDHTEDGRFRLTEMVPLRNAKDITDYSRVAKGFRAFFIRQKTSWARLFITSTLFEDTLSTLKVSMRLKDLLLYFGEREREVEIVPPRLKCRCLEGSRSEDIGGYEHTYSFRFFENHGRGAAKGPTSQWSIRQSAVYCRHEPHSDGTTWLFVGISWQAQRRLDDYISQQIDLSLTDPFDIHLLLVDTALSNWRPYLVDLATELDEHTAEILGMSPDDQGPISLSDAARRQDLMLLDEKLLNALLVAKATMDTVNSLKLSANSTPRTLMADPKFTQHMFNEQACDLELYITQLDALRTRLLSASTLLSSFLDLGSGLALQNLARESRHENESMRKLSEEMHELTKKATKDAVAVKVLTIMTLIYLPATVVSNFFSTSFVNTEGASNHIAVSGDWWIFVVISVPLTIFTLYVWYVWKEYQADGKYPAWWRVFVSRKKKQATSDPTSLLCEKV